MVQELLERAQVDRVFVFAGDDEAKHVHIERAGRGEIGDDQFRVGAAEHVRWGCGHDCSFGEAPKRAVWTGPSDTWIACWSV